MDKNYLITKILIILTRLNGNIIMILSKLWYKYKTVNSKNIKCSFHHTSNGI